MVREEKIKEVEELKKLLESYSVIGLVDMAKMPTRQLNEIRRKIKDVSVIKMSKKSLMKLAIKEMKKEKISSIENFVPSQPAMIFTNLEPFRFFKLVVSLKSLTFAKEGDVIGKEIEIKPGPTELLPGPAISELQKVGLIVGVEGGKIAVKKGKIVAKKGDVASKELSSVLRKLKIEPIEVKLNIVALYRDGDIYSKDILDLVEIYPNQLKEAFNQALNLSVNIGYPTKENIKYLLAKAYQQAKFVESKIGGV
jgi:large subunit ribosomal protein L10